MKIKIAAVVIGISLAFVACTPALTPEEATYLDRINKAPLTFTLPKDEADKAWGRIQAWVALYSPAKIRVASDFIIQTESLRVDLKYAYIVTRAPKGEVMDFTIKCDINSFVYGPADKQYRNARILAHYAMTAELMPKFISQ